MRTLSSILFFAFVCASSAANEAELLHQLKYEENEGRPLLDSSRAVYLKFAYTFMNIVDFDEINDILTIHGWFKEMWDDEYMVWDAERTGIRSLRLRKESVWHPDIRSYQSLDDEYIGDVLLVAYSTGTLIYMPPVTHRIQCDRLERYSFLCVLNLGSWSHHMDLIHMSPYPAATNNTVGATPYLIDTSYYRAHPLWSVTTSAEIRETFYDCCPEEPYQSLEVVFTLHRK